MSRGTTLLDKRYERAAYPLKNRNVIRRLFLLVFSEKELKG
ncbi:hypothetical protein B4134_1604 [Bacillus safensis]|nr:hypothetical protein B4107_1428 [Bacillus safensis]KIL20843.1 hypothetical protein B4134_1604 [Bacillus safensis]